MMNIDLAQALGATPLFALLGEDGVKDVCALLEPVYLRVGETLFREGEPGRDLWVLGPGVEVSIATARLGHRAQAVMARARTGDVVGELALVDEGCRSGTAAVMEGGVAYRLDGAAFRTLRAEFSPTAFKVLRKLCVDLSAKLRRTNSRIVAPGPGHVTTPPLGPRPRPDAGALERFAPFRGLPSVVKLALGQQLELVQVAGVTPLFAEQEPSDGAWFLVEGEVVVGRNGRTLTVLREGAMFGQVACLDHGPRSASCVTAGAATLFRMTEPAFEQLFAAGHRFAFQMVDLVARQLAQHLREANQLVPLPWDGPLPAALSLELELAFEPELERALSAASGR